MILFNGYSTISSAPTFLRSGTQTRTNFSSRITLIATQLGSLNSDTVGFLPDGKILNEEVIKAGLAWHYRVKNPHSTFLEKMEYKA